MLLCGLVAVVASEAMAADTFEKVTVDKNGPDRGIPTDASFYIAGTASAEASQINVLIVRTGKPWITSWIADRQGEQCEVVAARLNPQDKVVLPELRAGTTTADRIWRGAPHDWTVRVGATAAVKEAKDKAWAIPFDKDTEFFSAGHRYCVFVYESKVEASTDEALAKSLIAAVEAYTNCLNGGNEQRCKIDDAQLQVLISQADAERQDALRASVNAAIPDAKRFHDGKRALAILDDWEPHVAAVQSNLTVTPELRAALVAGLIAANKMLPADADTVAVALSRNAAGQLIVDAGAVHLGVDDAAFGPAPVLRDLIELSLGRLPLATSYVAIADYARTLAPITAKADKPLTTAEDALLDSAATSLDRVSGEIIAVHSTNSKLRDWLLAIERPCDAAVQRLWKVPATSCGAGTGWATYGNLQGNPLAKVTRAVANFRAGQPQWLAHRPVIVNDVVITRLFSRPFGATVEMTQKAWFFSYCSPVIGYAMSSPNRPGHDESISLRYYGLQIHALPNPAHKPELDAGILALELGFSPGTGSFGPDNRFRGWHGIVPWFVGGAVHLIPYTSLSIGMMAADRRSSTFPQEGYHTFYDLYIGVSVDANVPDLVRSLTGSSSSTTAVPTKGGTP